MPYAIAAKFAFPTRVVIATVGGGAMQMNGNSELVTISKYWKQWQDPRLIVLVLNNRDLNLVTWEERVLAGDRKFTGPQEIPDFPNAAYAELLGLKGIRVDNPDEVAPAWEEAFAANRPVVSDAYTDPEVPALPPHITVTQAKNYMKSILKGDVNAGRMVRRSFGEMVEEHIH